MSRLPSVVGERLTRRALLLGGCVVLGSGCQKPERGEHARLAAAANMQEVLDEIGARFRKSGNALDVSYGSSGKLFAQIVNGAPFDALLSADAERPEKLEQQGLAVKGTRFTYAIGRLALYGRGLAHPDDGRVDLKDAQFRHLAIANPETAPYGVAAVTVLERIGVWNVVRDRAVRGENVVQTLQFVDSGGAELGLVALSTVVRRSGARFWKVPSELHEPIRQDAVLLAKGRDSVVARSFLDFLRGPEARELLEQFGYDVPQTEPH